MIGCKITNKTAPVFFAVFAILFQLHAQQFTFSGKVQYERKENLHKQLSFNNSWSEELKKRMPKYRTDQFQLAFNRSRSFYKITVEDESPFASWARVAYNNSVSTDFGSKKMTSEKTIYERTYRIEDSMPAYKWKMLGEYRNIAGYNCRKACTIIMDSLYIIAFYTDEIPVSGGPESFQGLPGMILGIVVPRINLTLFATKVERQTVNESEMLLPENKKSKKTNNAAFIDELTKALKDWGEFASKVYWKAVL